jgi:hypothetical protein
MPRPCSGPSFGAQAILWKEPSAEIIAPTSAVRWCLTVGDSLS